MVIPEAFVGCLTWGEAEECYRQVSVGRSTETNCHTAEIHLEKGSWDLVSVFPAATSQAYHKSLRQPLLLVTDGRALKFDR